MKGSAYPPHGDPLTHGNIHQYPIIFWNVQYIWKYNLNYVIAILVVILEEEFGDIKGVIRIRKSKKDRQHNGQKKKRTKGQTTIYKASHIKLKIEYHEHH